jgi:DNA-binding winged helix-turn-helix (wHTH) protein
MVEDFWVDGWLVQPRYNLIIRKDRTVFMRPIAMATLEYLAKRSRRAVPASEMLQAIWSNTTIPCQTLACVLSEIQEAFRVDNVEHHIFRLMPDLGCRLDAEVKWHAQAVSADAAPPSSPALARLLPGSAAERPDLADATGCVSNGT